MSSLCYASSRRTRGEGIFIKKSIVYGSSATSIGIKRQTDDDHTHQWTVYLKPYHNEDMSIFVKGVHFKLHHSFSNPDRYITKPPYEITETGWGEFEIAITMYFNDPHETPVTLYHALKLFDPQKRNGPIVSQKYDEILFQNPTQTMRQMLAAVKPLTTDPWVYETDFDTIIDKRLQYILDGSLKSRRKLAEMNEKIMFANWKIG